ncbi:hypothetical protein AB0O86_03905 [Streptomyces hirsutus]|uniref:hypothetical protein n=1 Tax=Streptomyces hirsutus TaxID=35620 RepID=UPI0034374A8E
MTHDKRLGELLHDEADAFPVGPAPVDDVLHRGRRGARRRRTAAAAGAITAVTALLAFGAAHLTPTAAPAPAPPATAPPHPPAPEKSPHPTAPEKSWRPPRTVDPYEPVPIGHGFSTALLPDGRQNSVVGVGDIAESVEQARNHTGDNIRPDSLSFGTHVVDDHVLFHGAFRADTPPAGIDIALDSGARHTATLLSLPGDPGWGTYYAFGDASAVDTGVTVTAYAEDGGVLFEQHVDASPRD